MKKLLLLFVTLSLLNCKSDDVNANCNFLLNVGVNLQVDLNLPQYNPLMFPQNGVYVDGQGNNGIWLWRLNSSVLYAWDAADPSKPPSACSTLTTSTNSAEVVVSGCEDANKYSLSTGLPVGENTLQCTLKPYRVDNLGNGRYLISN